MVEEILEEGMDFMCWTSGVMCYLTLFVFLLPICIWLYKELTMGICTSETSLDGKVVLITGGSNGIGFETAIDLAKRGAKLIIGCRKTNGLIEKIQRRVPGAHVDVIPLDLSAKSSIHDFVEQVKSKYNSIHVLINNAGMVNSADGPVERVETKDGFELVMATNHLGHCLLNHSLLDLVQNGAEDSNSVSRIILVSSMAVMSPEALDICKPQKNGTYAVNFDLEENVKDARRQYSKTKLAQVMYANHLAEKFLEENEKICISCLHPGFVRTEIFDGFPKQAQGIVKALSYIMGKNPWQGAQTTLHLATQNFEDPIKEINGKFFADCRSNLGYQFLFPKIMKDELACKYVYDETLKILGIE